MSNPNHNQTPLGINKLGKSIRKSPLHVPNQPPNQPQPLVYNISKNEFRSIVQQLTGTPSRSLPVPNQPQPAPNQPPPNRLHRIRPPPLAPIARPPLNPHPLPNHFPPIRPHPIASESPVSAYMRYLENSLNNPTPPPQRAPQLAPPPQPLLPTPPPLSPLLPSPSAFLNLLSPRSPYPLLSPNFANFQFPPPLSPGILGPPPQPPLSPGLLSPFPLSPSAFLLSPRWRNM